MAQEIGRRLGFSRIEAKFASFRSSSKQSSSPPPGIATRSSDSGAGAAGDSNSSSSSSSSSSDSSSDSSSNPQTELPQPAAGSSPHAPSPPRAPMHAWGAETLQQHPHTPDGKRGEGAAGPPSMTPSQRAGVRASGQHGSRPPTPPYSTSASGSAPSTSSSSGAANAAGAARLVAELRKRVESLERQLRASHEENEALRQDAAAKEAAAVRQNTGGAMIQICPSLFTVHKGFVRRAQLGRCSSLHTQEELSKVRQAAQERAAEQMVLRFRNSSSSSAAAAAQQEHQQQQQQQQQPGAAVSAVASVHAAKGAAYFAAEDFAHDLIAICERAKAVFSADPRVLSLASPCYIFGDIHGNLTDLQFFQQKLWTLGMGITAGTFLFLGDYVDRGQQGLEVVAFLFAQKICCPSKLFLLRGNHELRAVNGNEAFYREMCFLSQCCARFGAELGHTVWEAVNQVFDCMPMAAVVDEQVFCVHGGFPREMAMPGGPSVLEALSDLPCPCSISPPMAHETEESVRLSTDLLWADPADAQQESYALDANGFGRSPRGGDVICFGRQASDAFLARNGYRYLVRAHQAQSDGIGISKGAKVLTVFSTSKDHGCGNEATCGCLVVDQGKITAITRATRGSSSSTAVHI